MRKRVTTLKVIGCERNMFEKVKLVASRSLSALRRSRWLVFLGAIGAVAFITSATPLFAQAGGAMAGTALGRVACMAAGYTVNGLCPLVAVAGFGVNGAAHVVGHERSGGSYGWVAHAGIGTGIIASAATLIGLYGMTVAGCVQ